MSVLEDTVGDLREDVAKLEGQMGILVSSYERTAAQAAANAAAELEIRKANALAEIVERKASGAARRQVLLKLAAILTGVWAIVSSMLASRC